jgi:hypothetical protein
MLNTLECADQLYLQLHLYFIPWIFSFLYRLLNRLYGLSNIIYNSSATPKLLIYQHLKFPAYYIYFFFLPIMATILVVPISRPTAIFSFPLSIYLVQTTCFVNLRSIFLYLYNELSKTAFEKKVIFKFSSEFWYYQNQFGNQNLYWAFLSFHLVYLIAMMFFFKIIITLHNWDIFVILFISPETREL